MLREWFDNKFTLMREEWQDDGDGNKTHTERVIKDSFPGFVTKESDDEAIEGLNLSFKDAYVLLTEYCEDIKEGDLIKNHQTGESYNVVVVKSAQHKKVNNSHYRIILNKQS